MNNLIHLAVFLALVMAAWRLAIVTLDDWIKRDVPRPVGMAIGIAYFVVGALAAQYWGLL